MDRQGWFIGGVGLILATLVIAGWLARNRFTPVEVGTPASNSPHAIWTGTAFLSPMFAEGWCS